jgi:hypothetical protein
MASMDAFECAGYWWLPDNPDKEAPGTLTFSHNDGLELRLLASLESGMDFMKSVSYDVVLGITTDGKRYTLLDCIQTDSHALLGSELGTQTLYAHTAVRGAHFDARGDILIDSASAEFTYLPEWAGISGFTADYVSSDRQITGFGARFEYPEEFEAMTDAGKLCLTYGFATKVDLLREVNVRQSVSFKMDFAAPQSLDDLNKRFVAPLQQFLTLATRRANAVSNLFLSSPSQSESPEDGKPRRVPMEMFYQPVYVEPSVRKRLLPHDLLFARSDIIDDFSGVMSRWMTVAGQLETLCSLFFSVRDAPFMYTQHRFLNVAHAAELFHRTRFSNEVLPKEQHREHVRSIVNAAPDTQREWLSGALAHSNEPTFVDRIGELYDSAQDVMQTVAPRSEFCRKVRDTRNYHTHYAPNLKDKAATDGPSLHNLTEKLAVLVEACLLQEMGISGERRATLFRRNRHYDWVAKAPL